MKTIVRKLRIAATPRSHLLKTTLANGAVVYGINRAGYGGRGVFLAGDAYEPEFEALEQLLGCDGVFVDVGANTGVYTLKAARHFEGRGVVVAVEPFVEVLSTLARSVEVNGFVNVRLRNLCLGGQTSARTLWMNRNQPNSFSVAHRVGGSPGRSVLAASLDDLMAWEGLDRLDYLKIDAEGAEEEILSGGVRTILQCQPIIQLETTIREVRPQLAGYVTFRAPCSPNVVLIPRQHPRFAVPTCLGWRVES